MQTTVAMPHLNIHSIRQAIVYCEGFAAILGYGRSDIETESKAR